MSSHPHPPLHLSTDLPLLLIESVSENIQRSGYLCVAQNSGHRSYIRPSGDHQAGGCVPQAVDVQVQGKAVLFENQFEPPGESAGSHGQIFSMAAEDIVLWGERASLVQLQLPFTEGAVLFQEAGHLQGEVGLIVFCPLVVAFRLWTGVTGISTSL